MKSLFRLAACASLFGALITGGNYACPSWSAHLGLGPAEWLKWHQQLERERVRAEILAQQDEIIRQTLEAEIRVIEDLRDQRLTLLEAAARFRDLGHPVFGNASQEWFRRAYGGHSDEERWCRRVISFAQGDGLDQPDMTPLADRLEAELAAHLALGPLHLEGGEPRAATAR